jgi:hypothetical protein
MNTANFSKELADLDKQYRWDATKTVGSSLTVRVGLNAPTAAAATTVSVSDDDTEPDPTMLNNALQRSVQSPAAPAPEDMQKVDPLPLAQYSFPNSAQFTAIKDGFIESQALHIPGQQLYHHHGQSYGLVTDAQTTTYAAAMHDVSSFQSSNMGHTTYISPYNANAERQTTDYNNNPFFSQ